MFRSFLMGALGATALTSLGLVSLVLLTPPPATDEPPATAQVEPASEEPPVTPQTELEVEAETPEVVEAIEIETPATDDDEVAVTDAPDVTAPDVDAVEDVADADPLDKPEATIVEAEIEAPAIDETAGVDTATVDTVLIAPQGNAPQAPRTDQIADVSTQSADPIAVPDASEEELTDDGAEPSADAPAEAEETSEPTSPDADAEPAMSLSEPLTQPENEEDSASLSQTIEFPNPNDAEERTTPRVIKLGEGGSSLPTGDSGVRVNRVITDTAPEAVEIDVPAAVPSTAFERFAADFNNPQGKRVMGVVLLHEGSLIEAIEHIATLPFPVTVVLDSGDEQVRSTMLAYRTAGAEVALKTNFPTGARANDVEVAMQSALGLVPDAVAFVDPGDTGLQDSRDVTNQTIEVLAADGRGLLIAKKGLNSALRVAEGAGIPSATIYRDLDAEGQTARVIGRFLEQAAFQARRDDGVILLGRMRDETIEALRKWAELNETGLVTLGPLSAAVQP